jgi:tetratricopeptide (TPR) repeat protein
MALRRYAKAMRQFNQALAIAPDDYDALMRKINLLLLMGKTDAARSRLAAMPAGVDPQGQISSLRFDWAWLSRKPDAALAALENTENWKPDQPLRAEVWELKADKARALSAYRKKRRLLEAKLKKQPDRPDLWSALGLVEAGLGQRSAAIEAGRHAVALYPVATDVLWGPTYLIALARIYARLGEAKPATKLLAELLSMPAGRDVSVAKLRLNPNWDAIRATPGFQRLLKKYAGRLPSAGEATAANHH